MTVDHAPLEKLMSRYEALLSVCDRLEAIADDLPRLPGAERALILADEIEGVLAAMHEEEEAFLLPRLAQSERPEFRQFAAQMRREHDTDTMAAIEIRDALVEMGSGRSPRSPDAIGYMLRSFFESLRRHVHSERNLIALLTPFSDRSRALH